MSSRLDDPPSKVVLADGPPRSPAPGTADGAGPLRRIVGAVILAAMGLSAAYSANAWGLRDRYLPPVARLGDRTPAPAVAAPDAPVVAAANDIRSLPWWQTVTTLRGAGAGTTEPFTVDRHALQWRVKWRCTAGRLRLVPSPVAGKPLPRPLADTACPSEGVGFSVRTGRFELQATASSDWEALVEQQVDVPMVEPLPAGTDGPDAKVLATGSVYDVDRVGRGGVRIIALPDGARVLRLEDFFVSINSDLEIWLSEAPHPTSTPEAAASPHQRISFLKATAGSMNYEVPASVDLSRYRSIVIWCELTSNAYAAATLHR